MIRNYQRMIADKIRTEAYRKAIMETVKSGDIVLDLGTGLGILAFFACQAGAKKVYAIEEQPDIISVAYQICRANGFQDKVTFIEGYSTKVKLPEEVDVILTETLGAFAIDENLLPSIIDARTRFLKPGGVLIPSKVELSITAIESKDHYSIVEFWNSPLYGINFEAAREVTARIAHAVRLKETEYLSEPMLLKLFDLQTTNEIDIDEIVSFLIKRTGVLHGWGGWFDVQLSPNVSISTLPSMSDMHWQNIFFPATAPMNVISGNIIKLHIRAVKMNGYTAWWWQLV